MSSRLITLHFPDGSVEFDGSVTRPRPGDVIRRKGAEWLVYFVSDNSDGSLNVAVATHDATALVASDPQELDRRAWNLPRRS